MEYKLLSEEIPGQATILAALDVIRETCIKSTCRSCPLSKEGACMVEKIPVYWDIDSKIKQLEENVCS